MKKMIAVAASWLAICLLAGLAASALLWTSESRAAADALTAAKAAAIDSSWIFIGAATGLSSLGAGFAVARVGSAAVGALAEKPELFGRLLIFIGLAEGIAIYGLIVSILILNRLG
jgi:V/A-type H+/Na+-transporting ATPase subunit K